ncbi:protein BNI1-like [Forsythia ovata]|uniref:Protein BNI1-like n=1 Tax=Forsythia ovata TaxID=205694 RepID=A0ABD1RNN0_9LAMI
MADAFSNNSKPQKLDSQDSSNHSHPSKFSYNYLYKAAIVTIFLLLLPFFPSQAPEFINQTLHARSWEFLQLIFVGIAVSYGLFSKKNDETDKDHGSKFDNAQTYVSKLLQVSSVFDDETENQTVVDDNKVQTWNSQYYRGEPLMVVAKESPTSVEEQNATSSGVTQKPLLLPVRSLKQRVPETVEVDDSNGKTGLPINRSRSNSGSKRFTSSSSRKSRNEELEGINSINLEEKVEDNVVLRSPIPWRSRSGRMQMKENGDDPPSYSMEDSQLRRSVMSVPTQELSETELDEPPRRANFGSDFKAARVGSDDVPFVGKSVRTIRCDEFQVEKSPQQYEATTFVNKSKGFTSKSMHENVIPNNASSKKEPINEKVIVETSDDEDDDSSETEYGDDYFEGSSDNKGEPANANDSGNHDVGRDVDKKADEFIAKFREQIRLQRIESIRRSTAQRAAGNKLR